MIARRQDWRSRLVAWAEEQQGKPFAWGTTDCAALARSALIELFGEEITPLLPAWDSVRGAARILREQGSVGEILEALGAERTSVAFMRCGDLVVNSEPDEPVGRESVMVCIDAQQCLTSTPGGVVLTIADPGSAVYSLWTVDADV